MDEIRERLLRRDYLYADAAAYRAGVEAALAELNGQPQAPQVPATSADVQPHARSNAPAGHAAEALATAVGHA